MGTEREVEHNMRKGIRKDGIWKVKSGRKRSSNWEKEDKTEKTNSRKTGRNRWEFGGKW